MARTSSAAALEKDRKKRKTGPLRSEGQEEVDRPVKRRSVKEATPAKAAKKASPAKSAKKATPAKVKKATPAKAAKKATPAKVAKSAVKSKSKTKKTGLEGLLEAHDHLSKIETSYGVKVKCSLTQHEMPATEDAVKAYLASKKLFKAKHDWYGEEWVEEYQPHIVAHKRNDKKLYCTLTKLTLNKIRAEVDKHVGGRRFRMAKLEFDEKAVRAKEKQEAMDKRKEEYYKKRDATRAARNAAKEAAATGEKEGNFLDNEAALLAMAESDEEDDEEDEEDDEEGEDEDGDEEEEEEDSE